MNNIQKQLFIFVNPVQNELIYLKYVSGQTVLLLVQTLVDLTNVSVFKSIVDMIMIHKFIILTETA